MDPWAASATGAMTAPGRIHESGPSAPAGNRAGRAIDDEGEAINVGVELKPDVWLRAPVCRPWNQQSKTS